MTAGWREALAASLLLIVSDSALASLSAEAYFDSVTTEITSLSGAADYGRAAELAGELSLRLGAGDDWRQIQAGEYAALLEGIATLPAPARHELAEAERLQPLIQETLETEEYDRGAPLADRQLEIRMRIFGAEHLLVAESLANVSYFLIHAGDLARSEIYSRRALELMRDELGPDNPRLDHCLTSLNNLAVNHLRRDNLDTAAQLLREVIAERRHLLGDAHNRTAGSVNNLAVVYRQQGRDAELEPLLVEALATQRRLLGDAHRKTTIPMMNLGRHYGRVGRFAEGEALLREALDHRLAEYGPGTAQVAMVEHYLGDFFEQRGDFALADSLYLKVFAVYEREFGANDVGTGGILFERASLLMAQGNVEEAEGLLLDLLGRVEIKAGARSLYSMQALVALAQCRLRLGDLASSEDYLVRAAELFESARLRAGAGFERATFRDSPYSLLAAVRLLRGDEVRAWPAAERALGRALADLLISAGRRGLDAEEAATEQRLRKRLSQLESQLAAFETADSSAVSRLAFRDASLRLLDAEVEWDAFGESMAGKYPVAEGQAYDLERVQSTLDGKTALVGWLDVELREGERVAWGYVIRESGPVRWERIYNPRSRAANAPPDLELAERLRSSLRIAASWRSRVTDTGEYDHRAGELWDMIGGRLERHLRGVSNLVIVHSGLVQGIPVEALVDGEGHYLGDRFAISRVSSATVHGWLREKVGGGATEGSALLLADPPFAQSQLVDMAAGEAGDLDSDEWALLTRDALSGDGSALDRLPRIPWTRREAESLAPLFGNARVLLGPEASEESLYRMSESGELARFETIHLATHALVDVALPMRSALVLSRVGLPDPLAAAMAGGRVFDGLLRAGEIIREWEINADLVTLSACKTGLGRDVAGEGYQGLANAFLQAGARCVLVSLWRVEDRATSMLMQRFYESMTKAPAASKASALGDAKRWLREWRDAAGNQPFRHPVYWSGFVLIGDPI